MSKLSNFSEIYVFVHHKWLVMRFKKDKCVIRACLCHCASMCWEGDSFKERDSVLFVFLVILYHCYGLFIYRVIFWLTPSLPPPPARKNPSMWNVACSLHTNDSNSEQQNLASRVYAFSNFSFNHQATPPLQNRLRCSHRQSPCIQQSSW